VGKPPANAKTSAPQQWVRQASPYGRATALERAKQAFENASAITIAFSSEVDTVSREENASK
jgi:hypothetical protein